MNKLNLAVLKAHRLKDTSTFGKQDIYLRLTAGSAVKTSDVIKDAGTDCALGEIFTLELPPGTLEVHLEVLAKHSLTDDESIGTAKLLIDLIRDSDGEVLRVPVMSKKGSMHGELECTGSISDSGPSAPQIPAATGSNPKGYPYSSPYPQQQRQPGPYPAPNNPQQQQQQQQPPPGNYQPAPAAPPGYPAVAAAAMGAPMYPQQQQGGYPPYLPRQQPQYPPAGPQPYPATAGYGSNPVQQQPPITPYPPPAGYPQPQQQMQPAPVQQQVQQPVASSAGMGRGTSAMGTAVAAGAGALGGAVVGGALSNMLFSHHGGGWGGSGWGSGPGYYDGGNTVIVNNYNTENVVVTENNDYQVDNYQVDNGGDWVAMDNGGDFDTVADFGGGDFGGGDW